MKFERFIARRYLFSGQNKALVSLITIISIAGVALGVLALIVVIAVMEGFDNTLQEQIIGANAHIEVRRVDAESPAITTGSLDQIRQIPGVKEAGPVIIRYALLQVPGEGNETLQTVLTVHGLDMKVEGNVTKMMERVEGNSRPGEEEIVIGSSAAKSMHLKLNDEVLLVIPRFEETAGGRVPYFRMAKVVGIFTTGFPEYDMGYGYTSLEGSKRIFQAADGQVDGLRIMVKNPEQVDKVANDVRALVGNKIAVTTWLERNADLFKVLLLEKWAMFIILLLIVLVAAFNIIGTLTMVVTDKTREIGILKSMGSTEGAILRIFRNQGLFIGGIGTTVGGLGGLLTCYILKNHVSIPQLRDAYMSDNIPVSVDPVMVILITGSSMLICLLASLYPARQAAKLDPVEALRYE